MAGFVSCLASVAGSSISGLSLLNLDLINFLRTELYTLEIQSIHHHQRKYNLLLILIYS